jgi:hypothetical protein
LTNTWWDLTLMDFQYFKVTSEDVNRWTQQKDDVPIEQRRKKLVIASTGRDYLTRMIQKESSDGTLDYGVRTFLQRHQLMVRKNNVYMHVGSDPCAVWLACMAANAPNVSGSCTPIVPSQTVHTVIRLHRDLYHGAIDPESLSLCTCDRANTTRIFGDWIERYECECDASVPDVVCVSGSTHVSMLLGEEPQDVFDWIAPLNFGTFDEHMHVFDDRVCGYMHVSAIPLDEYYPEADTENRRVESRLEVVPNLVGFAMLDATSVPIVEGSAVRSGPWILFRKSLADWLTPTAWTIMKMLNSVHMLISSDNDTDYIETEIRFRMQRNSTLHERFGNVPEETYTVQLYQQNKKDRVTRLRVRDDTVESKRPNVIRVPYMDGLMTLTQSLEMHVRTPIPDIVERSVLDTVRHIRRKTVSFRGFNLDSSIVVSHDDGAEQTQRRELEIEVTSVHVDYIQLYCCIQVLMPHVYVDGLKDAQDYFNNKAPQLTLPMTLTPTALMNMRDTDWITPKYDGVRTLLLVYRNAMYTCDRRYVLSYICRAPTGWSGKPWLFDGEATTFNGKTVIHVFDCVISNGKNLKAVGYRDRYQLLHDRLPATPQLDVVRKPMFPCDHGNFALLVKRVHDCLIPPIGNVSEYLNEHQVPVDGIVAYKNLHAPTPDTFKWKMIHTIDLVVKDGRLYYGPPHALIEYRCSHIDASRVTTLYEGYVVECELDESDTSKLRVIRKRADKKRPNSTRVVQEIIQQVSNHTLSYDDVAFHTIALMSKFHNMVKKEILERIRILVGLPHVVGAGVVGDMIDVGSGKGPDVAKWKRVPTIRHVWSVEPLSEHVTELQRRIETTYHGRNVVTVHPYVHDLPVTRMKKHVSFVSFFFCVRQMGLDAFQDAMRVIMPLLRDDSVVVVYELDQDLLDEVDLSQHPEPIRVTNTSDGRVIVDMTGQKYVNALLPEHKIRMADIVTFMRTECSMTGTQLLLGFRALSHAFHVCPPHIKSFSSCYTVWAFTHEHSGIESDLARLHIVDE